jgi:hypothetical protein
VAETSILLHVCYAVRCTARTKELSDQLMERAVDFLDVHLKRNQWAGDPTDGDGHFKVSAKIEKREKVA